MGRKMLVKPAKCESRVIKVPYAPCEIFDGRATPGILEINGMEYTAEIIGYLPPAPAEPVIDGYRLTKGNGEAHDICCVAGRLECTCGDYEFRRSMQYDAEMCDCKHIKAIRNANEFLPSPRAQRPELVPVSAAKSCEFCLRDLCECWM